MYYMTSPYTYPRPGHYPVPQPHPQSVGPLMAAYPVFVHAPASAWRPVPGYPVFVPLPLVGRLPVVRTYRPHDGFALEVNRYFSGLLGMNPNQTISTNIALAISRATGIEFPTAKRLFHGGVAGFVAWALSAFGLGLAATVGAGALLWAWLESFDDSAHRR